MYSINNELKFSGVGLHSGLNSTLTLIPTDSEGIFFKTKSGLYPITAARVAEDNRLTGFKLPDGTMVRTGEHMLAAISGMGVNSLVISLEGEEVPILDGSAYEFASAINEVGLKCISDTDKKTFITNDIAVADLKHDKVVSVLPSEKLIVTYVIDYPGSAIGTQKVAFKITPEVFLEKISKARTFCLTDELDYLKQNGLAKGGSLDNAMVFAENGLVNESGFRIPLECVTHKVIDILGDLTLLGSVPVGHYVSVCGGHAMHAKLVEKIRRSIYSI